jgi:hypothetical protein
MKDLKHIKRFNESVENLNISDVSESILSTEFYSNIISDLFYDLDDIDEQERMLICDMVEDLTTLIDKSKDKKMVFKSVSTYFKRLNKEL